MQDGEKKFLLIDNAVDSLNEFLNFLEKIEVDHSKIRIAILLFDNFLELFFKSYIAEKQPLLIYERPSDSKSLTIGLKNSCELVKRLGYELEKEFESNTLSLRKLRNSLNHHESTLKIEEWYQKMGQILYHVIRFDEKYQNVFNIHSRLSGDRWRKTIDLKEIFEKHKKESIEEAKKNCDYGGKDEYFEYPNLHPLCPECQIEGTSCIQKDRKGAFCYYCRASFPIQQCDRCGEHQFTQLGILLNSNMVGEFCDTCLSWG